MRCVSDLCLRALQDDNEWALTAPLRWLLDDGMTLTVPENFITDLASIPRVFQNVLSVTGKSRRAAVLHDFLYCTKWFSRARSDNLLRLALIAEGMAPAEARIYWLGVRAGGWLPWMKREGIMPDDFVRVPLNESPFPG